MTKFKTCEFKETEDGGFCCSSCGFQHHEIVYRNCDNGNPLTTGVGTQLEKLLSSLGIVKQQGCECGNLIVKMNIWGPDECLRQIEYLVLKLQAEATRRKWLLASSKLAGWSASRLIKEAVKRERRRLKSEVSDIS